VVPPAYPTRVRTIPGRLPNWESGPQNQPNAKVAVLIPLLAGAPVGAAVRGSQLVGVPRLVCSEDSVGCPLQARAIPTTAAAASSRPKISTVALGKPAIRKLP
jgi:hypothetical protein